jgi:chromatin remodeling complex protein RSC6
MCKLNQEVINGDAHKKRTWYRKRLTIKVAGRKKAEENTMTPELKARTIEVSGRLERSNCEIPISERNCKFRIERQGIQGTDQQNHRAEGKNETPKLKTTRLPSSKNTNRFKKDVNSSFSGPCLR